MAGKTTQLAEVDESTTRAYLVGPEAKAVDAEGRGESTALKDEPWSRLYDAGDVMKPPYDLAELAKYPEMNSTLRGCVGAMVTNVVGQGFEFVPAHEDVDPDKGEAKKELERLQALFPGEEGEIVIDPRHRLPFVEIAGRWLTDDLVLGNGYLEVLRNAKDEIDGFAHLPGHTMRVRPRGGFVQIRSGKKVYFKEFGDERNIDYETGKEGAEDPARRANEVIHILEYSSRSDYYGIPKYVSATPAILGSREAAEYNYYFFVNNGVPRFVVLVNGGALSKDSEKYIREYLEANTRGVTNAHKVLVLEAALNDQLAARTNNRVTIRLEKLTVGVAEDASFLKYREANDDEVRGTFRLHPIFLGQVKDVNRANAIEARKLGEEQVFRPMRRTLNYIINATVVADMDIQNWRFRFRSMELGDPGEQAEEIERLSRVGGYTINDIRRERNLEPLEEEWADLPLSIAQLQLQLGGLAFDDEGKGLLASLKTMKTAIYDEIARRSA
ncbi:MAG: phage portal protein [Candidatus Zixiibacteriota bacterium]|jgi:PBSX family phage portal protein